MKAPRVLGIDDFAFRRGYTCGTILVDLEEHFPGDLLSDWCQTAFRIGFSALLVKRSICLPDIERYLYPDDLREADRN